VAAAVMGGVTTRSVKVKLEREPAWLPAAQRRLGRANAIIRMLLLVGFAASLYLTSWVTLVRGWSWADRVWGLDDVVILMPFFVATLVAWTAAYPADRAVRQVALELRLWASVPARPAWKLHRYLSFKFRQDVLIIAVPMMLILAANDFCQVYAREIREAAFGIAWADQALLVGIAGLVFLVAPVMMRYIWHTRPLPPGELRDRLERLCRATGLRYRRILIWESDGMVVNAAVMGLLAPVRYILLSDGLLEMMDDEKIEAVFGHEAGHVKLRHIQYFLLFAVCSMLIVGGVTLLAQNAILKWGWLPWEVSRATVHEYMQTAAMGLIVVIWSGGFGAVSRRFEWQADLFGARSVTPPADECTQPCLVHGTATTTSNPGDSSALVCATSAKLFADALHRIAVLNGIPTEAQSWRHSSIANRMRLLREHGCRPASAAGLWRSVFVIKTILLIGTIVGMTIAVWLYWPTPEKKRRRRPPLRPPARRVDQRLTMAPICFGVSSQRSWQATGGPMS